MRLVGIRAVVSTLAVSGVIVSNAAAGVPPARPERMSEALGQSRSNGPAHHGPRLPGAGGAGKILLPNMWSLSPAGRQVAVGDFPVNMALDPTRRWAAVLHAGQGTHEIAIVDLKDRSVACRVPLPEVFYGICFDNDGSHVYASGGEQEIVHRFAFDDGLLYNHQKIPITDPKEAFVPAGMRISADGSTLWVCGAWGHRLAAVPLGKDGTPGTPVFTQFEKGTYPYTVVETRDNLFVSLWGAAAVAVVDKARMTEVARWKTRSHPTEMALCPDGSTLYVACANSNEVVALSTHNGQTLEVITTALYPDAPNGCTPNSLALSDDGSTLLVADANTNDVAVCDVADRGHARPLGFIPVGWYPTSVRFGEGGRIIVANGKGLTSRANPHGPNPENDPPRTVREYIGSLMRGTVSIIDPPDDRALAQMTARVYACSPLRKDSAVAVKPRDENNPIPAAVGGESPIHHCVYIIKENRTYDQVLGDMPQGMGDASLCLFGEDVTPNHHALARDFVLLDNFYVESEVSADGHEWSTAAYATDFVEKVWPQTYRSRPGTHQLSYPSEGGFEIALPAGGYIWDRCAKAGVTYRSYGEFIRNAADPGKPGKAALPALEGHFDPMYRSFDTDYPDVKRASRFIDELHRFETEGKMPRLQILRLPSDHTQGTIPGKPTPTAMVADNDQGLGMVVGAISHSRFWANTAIFVVEDDAQNGPDHIDAHRTVAFVISPYARRGSVDSTMYSTSSMLRTMELILGLEPMSQFDAAATPMYASFTAKPNNMPYDLLPARVDLHATNAKTAWGADQSEKLNLTREDAADDLVLNEIVWKSVRGPDSAMPPPVRAAFVFAHDEPEAAEHTGDAR